MSNYTKSTNFATKDNLPTGDPLKIVKGTEIDTEFNNIATAISTKTDNASAAITGGSITGITDLAIADGGTGASTATAAINNLLPSQTSNANKYLQTDGTNVSWDAISINTGDITGTLAVANGGTGVTSSTGTGSVVLSNSPTLVTPSLGAATASTLDVSGNVTLSGGTANSIPYLNGSKVVTTGTELYFNGTNLGVGASASYRVDLGSATSDDAAVGIRIGRGGSSTTWSLIDNVGGSGNYRQYSSGTPTLRWLTSTDGSSWSEQMRLNSTGLGVGNNNPAAKLDVTGSALVSGSVTATSFAGALNGTVGATTPTTGAFTTVAASSSVTLSGGTANGVTYLNGSKVLTSGSALTFDGTNLGLGTASPTSYTNFTYATIKGTNGAGIALSNSGGTAYSEIYQNSTGLGIASISNLPVYFLVNNSEQMRLTSTGLGIGTSSPGYKLDVASDQTVSGFAIRIRANATSGTGGLQFTNSVAGSQYGWIKGAVTGLSFYGGNNSAGDLFLDSAGSLLLGTTLQNGTKLNVMGGDNVPATSGSTQNGGLRVSSKTTGSGGYVLDMGVSDTNGYAWMQVSNSANLASGFTKDLVINPVGGNLGLGVTPSAWGSGFKAFEVGKAGSGLFSVATDSLQLTNNYYYNGTNYIYAANGYAERYHMVSGQHLWYTAASGTAGNTFSFTQAMTLDASGNLALGQTSSLSTDRLTVSISSSSTSNPLGSAPTNIKLINTSNTAGNGSYITNAYSNANQNAYIGFVNVDQNYASAIVFATATSGASNYGERARIDSSGNLLIAQTTTTSPGDGNTTQGTAIQAAGKAYFSSGTGRALTLNRNEDGAVAGFFRSGTQVGSISVTTTATAYNTSSDQRLKENIVDADSASSLIDSLQVRKFDWKADGSHQRYGFVAQELVTVAPEAVHQPTDTEEMMAVDYSKLVPMLVKEIQSLRQRLAAANL